MFSLFSSRKALPDVDSALARIRYVETGKEDHAIALAPSDGRRSFDTEEALVPDGPSQDDVLLESVIGPSLLNSRSESLNAYRLHEPGFMQSSPEGSEAEAGEALRDHPAGAPEQATRRRILHMHIPKTAGTAVRMAFAQAEGPGYRIFPHYEERQFQSADPGSWDLFSGHYGFKTASLLGGDLVTVMRHPVDRFVSVYYFWQELLKKGVEVNRKTRLTQLYSLDDFVSLRDELPIIEEFFNRTTWQIAHGSSVEHRKELRDQGVTENQLLGTAIQNLQTFAVVGLQNRLDEFGVLMSKRFGVHLSPKLVNVTEKRPHVDDLSVTTRRKIYDWVYLDMELFEAAAQLSSRQMHL